MGSLRRLALADVNVSCGEELLSVAQRDAAVEVRSDQREADKQRAEDCVALRRSAAVSVGVVAELRRDHLA